MSHQDPKSGGLRHVLCHDIYGEAHRVAKQDLVHRPAGYVVSLTEGDLLLIQQTETELWDFPGGGCIPGEAPISAARRELAEETGLSILDDLQLVTAFEELYFDLATSQGWRSSRYYFKASGSDSTGKHALQEIPNPRAIRVTPVVRLISSEMVIRRLVTPSA